jgi:hypothetical protein
VHDHRFELDKVGIRYWDWVTLKIDHNSVDAALGCCRIGVVALEEAFRTCFETEVFESLYGFVRLL